MNVLIISSNRNRQPIAVLPLGACIVAEAGERAGHSVTMLDLMFADNVEKRLHQTLLAVRPDVVGISVRNIDNNDMKKPRTFFQEVQSLASMITKETKAPVVLGGAAISVMPEHFLRSTGAAMAVTAKGEIVFPELLAALEQKSDFRKIPGMAWLENGVFRMNTLPPAPTLVSGPCFSPDFSRWIDIKAYRAGSSTIPLLAKRGCPFQCVYCTYSISEGRRYELFEPLTVVKEIERLTSRGLRDIELVDNVFNAPYDHAMEICAHLARHKTGAHLQTMELNPQFVDDALLTAMEEAGFVGIGITPESADDSVLKGLGKNYTARHVRQAAQAVRRHKIPCFWIFLLGGPGETPATVERTLTFARNNIRPSDTAFFTAGIRIYPGTELEWIARREGILQVSAEEMLAPAFYLSPQLDGRWLTERLSRAVRENLNFLDADSFVLPALASILRLAPRLGFRQPLWRHTRIIRRGLQLLRIYG